MAGVRPMRKKEREVKDPALINKILAEMDAIRVGLFDGEEVYIVPLSFGSGEDGVRDAGHQTDRRLAYLQGARVIDTHASCQLEYMHSHEKEESTMAQKYCCKACDYVYNPQKGDREGGVAPGVAFEDLPENWICPECGVGKEYFEPVGVKED